MSRWYLPSTHINYLNVFFTFFNCREFDLQPTKRIPCYALIPVAVLQIL
jgi:hypothetical protein